MILITGGTGFIGLHTARAFLEAGEDVVVTRFRTSREPPFIKEHVGKRFFSEQVDITNAFDMAEIARKHKVTGIVHLASPGGYGNVASPQSAAEDYRTNTLGLINVLEAGRAVGVRRITLASSSAVYTGTPLPGPFNEDMTLNMSGNNPITTYKKMFEIVGNHYALRTGTDVMMARISAVYGPVYHSGSNLPSRLVHAAVRGVPGPLTRPGLFPPLEGDTADLAHGQDVGEGIRTIHMAEKPKYKVYNIGSGAAVSNARLADAVRAAVPGAQITLEPGRNPNLVPNNYLDLSRIKADLGWQPKFNIETGIADYVAWLQAGNEQ